MNQDVLTPRIRKFMDIQRKKDISEFVKDLKDKSNFFNINQDLIKKWEDELNEI